MKKIYHITFDAGRKDIFLPMFWFGLKRYYEINGRHSNDWNWIKPVIDYSNQSFDEICQEAISHNATVYAFSSYIWNWNLVIAVSKKIKEVLPNSIIVIGGPNQGTTYTDPMFWFKKYPHIDATCKPTEYGEFFITDLLDSISENNLDWNNIRNSYHRTGYGPLADKRSFVFPTDTISSHLDIAFECVAYSKSINKQAMVLYETTRGCPYGCTYCEWGGGINSKIISKSLDTIKDELNYLSILDVSAIYLCDANFGILPRDAEVARLFVDYTLLGLKHVTIMGLAKTSASKRKAVLEPLFEAGLITRYMMAIQTTNPQALKAIDRTDVSIEENLELGAHFLKKYNADVTVELILGLPGTTLADYYNELDYFYTDYSATKYFITVLPDSPFSDPNYIKKWGIQLVPAGTEGEDTDNVYMAVYDETLIKEPFTFLSVASNTFTVEEWKEISFMSDFEVILTNRHMLKPFTDFMIKNKKMSAGYLLKKIFLAISSVTDFYKPIDKYLTDITNGKYALKDYKKIESYHVFRFYHMQWIANRRPLFEAIRKILETELDDISLDCLNYTEHTTFRETDSVSWSSTWDWKTWEQSELRGTDPELKSVHINTEAKSIQWSPTIQRTAHSGFNLPLYDNQVVNKKSKLTP
jgi:radical SAM superfamily enzyme YgiQ (UPF0313 family)